MPARKNTPVDETEETTADVKEPKESKGKKGSLGAIDNIEVMKVDRGEVTVCILGRTPIILNRMSEKARRELLMPKGRRSASERQTTLKHNPIEEYRASAYTLAAGSAPTYLGILATSFKGAMCTAALDLPGTKKAQIGRLTHVEGDYVPLYGIPQLHMSVVRSADMNRTPDIRTRAILPKWACLLTVKYIRPLIKPQAVLNLLAAAGMSIGVGDWRGEKGKGSFGEFDLVDQDNKEFLDILKTGGRKVQEAAYVRDEPVAYDSETSSLLAWFEEELATRKLRGAA